MPLNFDDFTVCAVNWENKADNLVDISNKLNFGVDALVFVDDSGYEVEQIEMRLPQVRCFKVTENIWQYPRSLRKFLSTQFPIMVNQRLKTIATSL